MLRLGADDTSLPNAKRGDGKGRTVLTQMRSQNDKSDDRTLQYWKEPAQAAGDAVNLEDKQGMESISLRGAFDGGTVLRLGAKDPKSKRRHLYNGYVDGQGLTQWGIEESDRLDSKSPGRQTYGAGDDTYRFAHLPNSVSGGTASYLQDAGAPLTDPDWPRTTWPARSPASPTRPRPWTRTGCR